MLSIKIIKIIVIMRKIAGRIVVMIVIIIMIIILKIILEKYYIYKINKIY